MWLLRWTTGIIFKHPSDSPTQLVASVIVHALLSCAQTLPVCAYALTLANHCSQCDACAGPSDRACHVATQLSSYGLLNCFDIRVFHAFNVASFRRGEQTRWRSPTVRRAHEPYRPALQPVGHGCRAIRASIESTGHGVCLWFLARCWCPQAISYWSTRSLPPPLQAQNV